LCVQRNARCRLQGGENATRIPARHPYDVLPRPWFEGENPAQATLLAQSRGQDVIELVIRQRLQRDQHGPRQQWCDDAERGVLGRRRDQYDQAVLHPRQQSVLLGLGEPVDLVQEEDGLPVIHVTFARRTFHDGPDVLDPRRDGRQLDEPAAGHIRHEMSQRRLAGPWRPPDDRGEWSRGAGVPLDQPPQRASGPQDLALPPNLVQGARTHPGGQGRQ